MEILEENSSSGCNDQTIVVKGKRSKRLRSPSSSASSSGGGESLCNSPAEEDEDMANCLILLARGGSGGGEITKPAPAENDKFAGRKFTETPRVGGVYVYECKTCSRTFPSFQALGGHRASHKKPKIVDVDADRKRSTLLLRVENKSSSKTHECSVCGTEFASGQALGGHMRRHRSTTTTTTMTKIITNDNNIEEEEEEEEEKKKKRRIMVALDLDLNLPAPEIEMEFRDRRFFSSTAALVDCHY